MMSNEMRELILETSDSHLVFGRDECFILIALGDDYDPADHAVLKDAISRGFALCGTLGTDPDGSVRTHTHLETLRADFTMRLAKLRYLAMLADRAEQVAQLYAMHDLVDPRWI